MSWLSNLNPFKKKVEINAPVNIPTPSKVGMIVAGLGAIAGLFTKWLVDPESRKKRKLQQLKNKEMKLERKKKALENKKWTPDTGEYLDTIESKLAGVRKELEIYQ